jgi:hypothetical protein
MPLAVEPWFDGVAGVVKRGPLVFSLKIAERRVESMHEPEEIRHVLKGNNVEGFPSVQFFPDSEWRYAMDTSLAKDANKVQVQESPIGENPFLANSTPVRLSVPLQAIAGWAANWKPVVDPPPTDLKLAAKNPTNLPGAVALNSAGATEQMTMLPYGATHLRLTTLPIIR